VRGKASLAASAIAVLIATAALAHAASAQDSVPASALTEAFNASGRELLGRLSGPDGNIVLSPYAIGSVMSMTLAGARNDTAQEMASVLRHSLGQEQIDVVNGQVRATLAAYDRSAVPPTCPAGMQAIGARCQTSPDRNGYCPFSLHREGDRCVGGATMSPSASLSVANALMLMNSPPVWADYTGLVKDKYAAEVFQNASLADVNGWVADKTKGKIDKILNEAEVGGSNAAILSAVALGIALQSNPDQRRTISRLRHIKGPGCDDAPAGTLRLGRAAKLSCDSAALRHRLTCPHCCAAKRE
jgi:serine protease inhibitor